jgi:ADP-heptose:LPS heptosyltransferase
MSSELRKNVVFIHWGSWGDLYVGAAALREVVKMFPENDLYIVGPEKWTQIIDQETWPTIKGIFATDNGWRGFSYKPASDGTWIKQTFSIGLVEFCKTVKATFNLRTESLRFAWAPWLARVPMRFGSAPMPWAKLLYTHRAPWLGKDPVIHERDRMLQVIEAPDKIGRFAHEWSQTSGLPAMKKPNRANAENLARARFGKYWLINPTSSRREKAWPSEKFAELFKRLQPILRAKEIELRVMGAPWETDWLHEVISERGGNVGEKTTVQPPTIQDALDVLGGAQVLITNTSSVQFLSPGLGVQTITLMGRANPKIWGPLGPRDIVVHGEINRDLDHDIFAQEREAYRSISVERVFRECEKILMSGI